MKKTYNIQFAVFGALVEGQSAQHRPQMSSGTKHVMAGNITEAITQVLALHPEAEVTGAHLTGVIDLGA